jgi:hypothetical protein
MNFAVVENGVVTNVVVWNGDFNTWQPSIGTDAVEIKEGVEGGIGYSYDGQVFSPPPAPIPTLSEILVTNTTERDALLAIATKAIAPLQDAIDLEEATDQEMVLLRKWKQYRIAVNRLDLTLKQVNWPIAPA